MKHIIYDYIIFHKNCFDGFSGFILFMNTKYHTKNIIIMPDVPSAKSPPVNIEGKNIIIIDVAYKPEIIKYISEKSKSMTYIDHHITHIDAIKQLKLKKEDKIIYDEKKCGASLVWKTFYNKSKPLFIRYIEDNDTGTWRLKYTLFFINGLETLYTTEPSYENIKKWLKLLEKQEVIRLIKKGKIYDEYKTFLIKQNAKKFTIEGFPSKKIFNKFPNFFTKEGQFKVAVSNTSCPNTSLLGKKLVETVDCDFALLWSYHLDKKEYVISLRSNKIDVSVIASLFGGGGHILAAAFAISSNKYSLDDLFLSESLPRNYK
jgi:oligoribonuclease NrnB/cAMP/cGMP phosphodiesterase (DHH superfamily)